MKRSVHVTEVDAMAYFSDKDPNAAKKMRKMFAPSQIDQQIRQAIQLCWIMLPENRKTVKELEKQIMRIVDRALKDLREDAEKFGLGK
jgi:hypothetical protein